MSIHLEGRDLTNMQQMEVAVNGPDGATHLILCTGVVSLDVTGQESYTFFVGPILSRRQFVAAIASGAISSTHPLDGQLSRDHRPVELGANLVSVTADYDPESKQVKVKAEFSSLEDIGKLSISYNVSILAELPMF